MSTNYDNMLKMYEESHQPKTPSNAKKYELKNYFSTYLEKTDKEGSKRIRILPPAEGKTTSVDVMWGHKIQVDGAWKTFPCLEHEEGTACPFCEARQALYASGTDSDKEIAKKYSARKMYILKLVERGNEAEGVKFWRFNHAYDKNGTLDKIMKAMKAVNHDVTDPSTGRDLNIEIARNQWNVPVVQSITYPLESTSLNDDAEVSKAWLEDTRTWRDVYSLRDYDYLKIVVKGDIPVFDKQLDRFIGKKEKEEMELKAKEAQNDVSDDDSELTMGAALDEAPAVETIAPAPVAETVTPAPVTPVPVTPAPVVETIVAPATPATADDEDDDLPF